MPSTTSSRVRRALTTLVSTLGLAAAWTGAGGAPAHAAAGLPTPAHIVVVIEENHSYGQIIGSKSAPYINSLAKGGANLTQMYAETHPSQPNYYDLFSGATQGITDDTCITPGFSSAASLGSELIAAGKPWVSYNESLPSQGSTVCTSGTYAQKHNPWFGFSNAPFNTADTFAQFPTDYTTLPPVTFVVPNLDDDMHDGTVKQGDSWLQTKLGAYATWAKTHNSLLVVTTDEDNDTSGNHIATVLYGQPVTPGSSSSATYNHFSLLRTLEDMEGLPYAGSSATASDITGVWTS